MSCSKNPVKKEHSKWEGNLEVINIDSDSMDSIPSQLKQTSVSMYFKSNSVKTEDEISTTTTTIQTITDDYEDGEDEIKPKKRFRRIKISDSDDSLSELPRTSLEKARDASLSLDIPNGLDVEFQQGFNNEDDNDLVFDQQDIPNGFDDDFYDLGSSPVVTPEPEIKPQTDMSPNPSERSPLTAINTDSLINSSPVTTRRTDTLQARQQQRLQS